jgi:hypothetical protein
LEGVVCDSFVFEITRQVPVSVVGNLIGVRIPSYSSGILAFQIITISLSGLLNKMLPTGFIWVAVVTK